VKINNEGAARQSAGFLNSIGRVCRGYISHRFHFLVASVTSRSVSVIVSKEMQLGIAL
jgi:hypothetical protein